MNIPSIARQFFYLLERSRKILLVSHKNPDGDTLGATFALLHFLQRINKKVTAYCASPVPKEYAFLPGSQALTNSDSVFDEEYDAVIVLDSGDLRYAGADEGMKRAPKTYTLVNIDHHFTNEWFGDVNIVDTSFASTTEILFHLFEENGTRLTPEMGLCLLTGICFDTTVFSNPSTSASVLEVGARLLSLGASLREVLHQLYHRHSIAALRLWGRALSRLSINRHGIGFTILTKKDFTEAGSDEKGFEGISNFLTSTFGGVRAICVVREESDTHIRASFRTNGNDMDFSKFCQFFGGGGHKKAAGFSFPGRLVCDEDGRFFLKE